jgi:hypothetical protein
VVVIGAVSHAILTKSIFLPSICQVCSAVLPVILATDNLTVTPTTAHGDCVSFLGSGFCKGNLFVEIKKVSGDSRFPLLIIKVDNDFDPCYYLTMIIRMMMNDE